MRVADKVLTTEADVSKSFSQGGAGFSTKGKGYRGRYGAGAGGARAYLTHSGSKSAAPIKLGVSAAELDDHAQKGAPRGKRAKKPY